MAASAKRNSCFCLLILLIPASIRAEETPLPVKIGLILPLSGPAAELGNYALYGAQEAVSKLGDRAPVQLVIEDDALDPKRSLAAFQKLTTGDKVSIVFSLASGPSNAIAPIAERIKVPLVALAGDTAVSRGRAHVIRSRISSRNEGLLLGQQIKKSGAKKTVLVCAENEFTLGVCAGVNEALGGNLQIDEVAPHETDFRSLINRIKSRNADSILLSLMPGKISLFAKQLLDLRLPYALWSTSWLYNQKEVDGAAGALNGARFVGPVCQKQFHNVIAEKHGDAASIAYSALYYELVSILAGCKSRDNLLSCIQATKLSESTLGSFGYVNDAGDQFIRYPWVLIRIDGTKFVAE
jgi:ABC-type branched-subunit amino acid transport system substrate-binding protein